MQNISYNLPPIICLMGPTAAGKTQLAIELVDRFPLEIISVDSAMVYRGMDIGTAKPTAELLQKIPHHLLDIRDPADSYSAAQFRDDALALINDITARHRIPLLVGGTMLYFRALLQGLADMPAADSLLRARLFAEGQQLGWDVLHARLQTIDPEAALRIHPHDSQRIQRALEVFELTGQCITDLQRAQTNPLDNYRIYQLAVAPTDRAVLHTRIAKRFAEMLAQGFIDEVQGLFNRADLCMDTPSMRSVGYRQVWQYLAGEYTYDTMRERGVIATRQLAKRQLTWLRHWPGIDWFDSESATLVADVVDVISSSPVINRVDDRGAVKG